MVNPNNLILVNSLVINDTKSFDVCIDNDVDVESEEKECKDIYGNIYWYLDYIKKRKLIQKQLTDSGHFYFGSSTGYVSAGKPNTIDVNLTQSQQTLNIEERNIFEIEKAIQDVMKMYYETRELNKNQIFYEVIEKAIYNEWFEFAQSLFPEMRDMTKEEQEIWNKLDDDISEIVEI